MPAATQPWNAGTVAPGKNNERRASVRYTCRAKGTWRPLGSQDAPMMEAAVKDVSAAGLSLVMNTGFKKGTILAVKLDCPTERFARPVLVRVAQSNEKENGEWQVGCSFTTKLDDEDLLTLMTLNPPPPEVPPPAQAPPAATARSWQAASSRRPASDPFVGGGSTEKRRAPRRNGADVTVLISRGTLKEEPTEGWVANRSMGGLCLSVPRPFIRDAVIKVRVRDGSDSCPWVQLRIKSIRVSGKHWHLGCEFATSPASNVLLMFG